MHEETYGSEYKVPLFYYFKQVKRGPGCSYIDFQISYEMYNKIVVWKKQSKAYLSTETSSRK